MKYLLLLLTLITFTVKAQIFSVDTTSTGIVKVTNHLNGVVNDYTNSNKLRAYISSGGTSYNTINIVNANGYPVLKYKGFSDSIKVQGVIYATNALLITALNELLTFSGSSSAWNTSPEYTPKVLNKPFKYSFNGSQLVNDSLYLGFATIPFVGIQTPNLGGFFGANGFMDGSTIGGGPLYQIGYNNILAQKQNAIIINDTSEIIISGNKRLSMGVNFATNDTSSALKLFGNGGSSVDQLFDFSSSIGKGSQGFETQIDNGINIAKMYSTSDNGLTNLSVIEVSQKQIRLNSNDYAVKVLIDSNGLTVPNIAVEPIGQNGAIYYNTALTPPRMRVYENGAWRDL